MSEFHVPCNATFDISYILIYKFASKVSKMIIWQFNILEFKREAEQGSQSEFSLAYQNQK